MSVEKQNITFYDNLYKSRNVLISYLHSLISFDQQVKSKKNKRTIEKFVSCKDKMILDYGFGHGSLLLKMPKESILFGCDISSQAVENMRKISKLFQKEIIVLEPQDFEKEYINKKFDIIFCSHVLEHVADDLSLIKKFSNWLQEGGYLLINIPINEKWKDPKHIREYKTEDIHSLFLQVPLKIVYSEAHNKWASFFIRHQQIIEHNIAVSFCLKIMRVLFSFISIKQLDWLEKVLLRKYLPQHLVVVCKKNQLKTD